MFFPRSTLPGRPFLFAATLVAGIVSPVLVNADSPGDAAARLDRLEFQAGQLSAALDGLTGPETLFAQLPPADIGDNPVRIAQSQDQAQINLRLSQMEEQIRVLTGQVEGLQFQMTQLQTALERMQEDVDFRFEQLDPSLGKTDAVTPSGGAMPSGGSPQTGIGADDSVPVDLGAPMDLDMDPDSSADFSVLGPDATEDFSADLEAGSDMLDGSSSLGEGLDLSIEGEGIGASLDDRALDLDFDPGALVTEGDADAQYRAGYEAVLSGDYVFAEAQFRQFVGLFPEHPQAPDATNWLGEALLQRGEYDEAAQILFDGFRRYERSVRAPDILLKLGIALAGAGEVDTACRTFTEVTNRYPDRDGAFATRVEQERAAARC